MHAYDKILAVLYTVALVAVFVELFKFWGLALIFILVLIITIVQKTYVEEQLLGTKKEKEILVKVMTERLDFFVKKLEDVKYDVDRHAFAVENRIMQKLNEYKSHNDIEMHRYYRELARKIFEVEERLGQTKRSFNTALGAMDDRLRDEEE